MDESSSPSEVGFPPDQKTLKDIADVTDTLSSIGTVFSTGHFKSKEYPLIPEKGGVNLTKVFVGQITQLGRERFPKMQDQLVVLESQEDTGRKEVSYQIYKDGDHHRIERYERVITGTDQPDDEDIDIFKALEGAAKKEEGRKLEKALGYTNIDLAEAHQLLGTLNKLTEQERP